VSPRLGSVCATVLLACALPLGAAAQGLRDLALSWTQGDFRAPLVCVLDGVPRQALRRVRIHPGPRGALPSARITFYDLEAPPATTCGGLTSGVEPNVIGVLELAFDGRSRPDTGPVDFRNALRREGGFDFRIAAGQLRIGPAGEAVDGFLAHDYSGGTAHVRSVAPGSDAERRLAPYFPRRMLTLELEAKDAPPLRFELAELPPR
jgi:hypothetical protein